LAVTMKSTPPPETPAAASINAEMRDLTGYSALSKDLKHHVSASSYEEAESIAEMQFLSGFMPREGDDEEDGDDDDEEEEEELSPEQRASQLIRSVSGTSLPSMADSQISIPSSTQSSFRHQLHHGSPFRLFTRNNNNSSRAAGDEGADGSATNTPSTRAKAGSGLDSDSFASDWTAETDNETDPQYETVILRSTQTDRPTYPKVADLFAVSPPSSPTTSPRPTSDLLTDVEDEDDHVAAAATGREVDDDGEEEEEAEGVLAETADDQAFLIRDEQEPFPSRRSSLLDKAASAVLRASGGSSSASPAPSPVRGGGTAVAAAAVATTVVFGGEGGGATTVVFGGEGGEARKNNGSRSPLLDDVERGKSPNRLEEEEEEEEEEKRKSKSSRGDSPSAADATKLTKPMWL